MTRGFALPWRTEKQRTDEDDNGFYRLRNGASTLRKSSLSPLQGTNKAVSGKFIYQVQKDMSLENVRIIVCFSDIPSEEVWTKILPKSMSKQESRTP